MPILEVPFQIKFSPEMYRAFLNQKIGRSGMAMGDFWSDLGNTVWDAVAGLGQVMAKAMDAIVQTVGQIMKTVALIIRAALGQVSWKEVLNSAGKIFQDIGSVLVILDPARIVYNWLINAPLTAHAFKELDKFTGGMITGVVNISDLPARAMRGDAISKQELIKDALVAIQIVAVVATGGIGYGLLVGNMVGREVCKHQTEYQSACSAAFAVAGASAGQWIDLTSSGLDYTYEEVLTDQGAAYLTNAGIGVATQVAVGVCAKQGWAGKRECQVIGQALADYIKTDPSDAGEWTDFLAREVVKIGMEDLMLQTFPPTSPEHQAILKRKKNPLVSKLPLNIKFYDANGNFNPTPFAWMLLAGGAIFTAGAVS